MSDAHLTGTIRWINSGSILRPLLLRQHCAAGGRGKVRPDRGDLQQLCINCTAFLQHIRAKSSVFLGNFEGVRLLSQNDPASPAGQFAELGSRSDAWL